LVIYDFIYRLGDCSLDIFAEHTLFAAMSAEMHNLGFVLVYQFEQIIRPDSSGG